MKPDELEIEKLAYSYFVESQKNSQNAENALLEKIYTNRNFILKIVSRNASRFSNVVEDLRNLKHEVVMKTFEQAKRNFIYDEEAAVEDGTFIKYFSSNLKQNTFNLLKAEYDKHKKEISINAPVNNDDSSKDFEEIYTDGISVEDDFIRKDEEMRMFNQALKSINKFYLSTKAGQQNKSAVYTFFVLECILPKPDYIYDFLFSEYDFLKAQKEVVDQIRKSYFVDCHVPDQKEFSKLTGCAESKFADMRTQLTNFLQNDSEMRAVLE